MSVLKQRWCSVTFVHWRYERTVLQQMVPTSLRVQEYDGSAWVSLTPLQMRDVRLPGTPTLPTMQSFPQTNLRTYVWGPRGKSGLWFLSIDAVPAVAVYGARLVLGAPYFRANLRLDRSDGVRYAGTRAGPLQAEYDVHVRPGAPAKPTAADDWLTNRWIAYTRRAGCLLELPVRHRSWSLWAAELAGLRQTITTAAGLPAPDAEPLVRYCDEIPDATFAMPRLARR